MSEASPVLAMDAPSNANLAVVRSLGRRGIPVGVLGFAGEFNLSFYSRYARERITLPSPARDAGATIEALARILAAGRYPILFPTTERTIQLVSANRAALPGRVTLPIPTPEAIEVAQDKERTVALARRLGVPTPVTCCPTGLQDLKGISHQVGYPAIVKPRRTNLFAMDGRIRQAAYGIATTPRGLERAYRRIHAAVPQPLVQELVTGVGLGVSAICDHGSPVAWFAHRRLREEDPRGGRSAAAVSVPCDPRLVECATRLLKTLAWHGVAMVEFKWDLRRDEFWLMEINGRFWGSLGLALAAGMDFPYYLYRLARREPVETPVSYPIGVVARDPVAELKHFVRVMVGPRRGAAANLPSRLETLRQAPAILHPWRASLNWAADDPEPGRREWLRVLARCVGWKSAWC
jgi:predicted ATP-grasp superfamily ATP-dependent carboligase